MIYNLNRFHVLVFLIWQFALIFALQNLFLIFSNFVPKWRCLSKNSTHSDFSYDCEIFEQCDKSFLRFEEVYYSTVLEFGWICTESAKFYTWALSTLQFFGVFIGTIIYGSLADKLGRKPVATFILSFGILMLALSGLSVEWWQFFVTRFLIGIANGGTLVVMYTYCMELVLPEQRMALETYSNWGTGRVVLTLVCYLFPHWRYSSFVCCLTSLPALLGVIFILPESPLWLMNKNKIEKFKKSEKWIKAISGQDFEVPKIESHVKQGLKTIFKIKEVLLIFLILCFSWFNVAMSAFAIDLNSPSLNGDFFLNQFLFSIVLMLSKFVLAITDHLVPQFNRRILHNYNQFISAFCFGAIAVLLGMHYENFIVVILSIIGLFTVEYTWDACYLITVEVMPTGIRSTVLGICSTVARVGALIAPMLVTTSTFWKPTVYIVLAIFGCINFVLAWNFLPETKGVNLADVDLRKHSKVAPVDA